ncbi:cellulose biosynthesis protein BcsS [Acidithiobacillus caldus]|uniref:cellulose biosynthesis protein BcsS n=1 Tax=Acidithiobacillus caldus TaxID=33059 RepID=UPI001C068026|nr:cellulose biosynthesis protein BcsS [Acidithiobacillus caldus]MBU2800763.1 cellulose biosynthesis protein BcsS [Acidithiobacillus caldus]
MPTPRSAPRLALVLAAFWAVPGLAQAGSDTLLLGGTQWGAYSSYSYLGGIQPLPGARLGQGWYVSGFVSYLRYRYTTGFPAQDVTTQAPGGNLGIGYASALGNLGWSLSGAVGYANFNAQPSSVVGAARPKPQGAVWTFTPQLQWDFRLSRRWSVAGIDSYSFGQASFWTDWRGKWRLGPSLELGPEGIIQGGPNYRIHQVGLFAQIGPFSGWQLGLAGGVSFQSGLANSGYAGLSFSKSF